MKPERLLAIHMAVSAIIEDDNDSHRVKEFRIVQVAKAAHRLASRTHKHWDIPTDYGTLRPIEFHAYPRSSGMVLREIGNEIEVICAGRGWPSSGLTSRSCRDGGRVGLATGRQPCASSGRPSIG